MQFGENKNASVD